MDRCRYRGAVTQRDRSSFAARRWMEGKGKIHRHFSWGGLPGGHGAATLLFILCYNKGNATWAAVASKEGKDET